MRVSENMKLISLVQHLRQNSSKILKYNNQIATAKKILSASDDPSGTSKLMFLNELTAKNERYQSNIEDAKLWLTETEAALNGVAELLSQAHLTSLKGVNDTLGNDDRRILATQVQQMLEQMSSYTDHKHGVYYLFGGTVTSSPPYTLSNEVADERFTSAHDNPVELENVQLEEGSVTVTSVDGSTTYSEGVDYSIDYDFGTITVLSTGAMQDTTEYSIAYSTQQDSIVGENPEGNSGKVIREIHQGEDVQINVTGSEAFTNDVDIFNALKQLKNALYRNDTEAIRAAAGLMENAIEQINQQLGEIGINYQILDSYLEDLKIVATQIKTQRSKIEDTDIAEAIVNLESQNTTYEATLKAGSIMLSQSLIDYLG